MKKKIFFTVFYFLISFFIFFLVIPENTYALNVRGGFYSRNPRNIIWQVGFRVIGNFEGANWQVGPRWTLLVNDTECFGISGCNLFKYFEYRGVLNGFDPQY